MTRLSPYSRDQLAKILVRRYRRQAFRAIAEAATLVADLVDEAALPAALEGSDPLLDLRLDKAVRRLVDRRFPPRHLQNDDDHGGDA